MFEPETKEIAKKMWAKNAKKVLELERNEGRQEERLETARKMKLEGLDIQLISRITELSEKEILEL